MAGVDVLGGADVGEEHGLEACPERGLRPEPLALLVELDHERQVAAALCGAGEVVEQPHVECRVLGDELGVVEEPRVADDLRDVGVGEQEVRTDGRPAVVELVAQGVRHEHGVLLVSGRQSIPSCGADMSPASGRV